MKKAEAEFIDGMIRDLASWFRGYANEDIEKASKSSDDPVRQRALLASFSAWDAAAYKTLKIEELIAEVIREIDDEAA